MGWAAAGRGGMSDPLSLLREQFINKKPVSHDATHIFIGDLKFSRNVLTAYKQDRGACMTQAARSRPAAGEAGAALPLRLPLLSSPLGPGCICRPHLPLLPSSPCPRACAHVVGAIHREQAVATRIRSRRYTICCRSRTLLVRRRCVPIMKSARWVRLQSPFARFDVRAAKQAGGLQNCRRGSRRG